MRWPSLSLIICEIFLAYSIYSIYTLSLLFVAPVCTEGEVCLTSYLHSKPKLQMYLFSSVRKYDSNPNFIHMIPQFDYLIPQNIPISLNIPQKTRNNGTLFLHILLICTNSQTNRSFHKLREDPMLSLVTIKMTHFAVPEAGVFKLLGTNKPNILNKKNQFTTPITHIKNKVAFNVMTDTVELPIFKVPTELIPNIRIVNGNVFLPILNNDILQTRYNNLVQVKPENDIMNITVLYSPISFGRLRLLLHLKTAMNNLKAVGFSDKDIDEVKGIFVDTNIYLLGGTFIVATIHLLFDFLAFKNEVSFWRKTKNLTGLSLSTLLWNSFSQTIIFLFLLEEGSSLLILIPSGISTIIEIWKLKKIFGVEVVRRNGFFPQLKFNKNSTNRGEKKTREFDAECMQYLNYILYPIVIVGAVYSLLYQPHKSWYSWTLNSLVSGIYAFGFIFMLPQLFLNYKLKSVAHLPWRTFMYKAFNTFIDDVFAFVITVPKVHRLACFRDDIVFLIYLYQRWLYPVDKTRIDTNTAVEEIIETDETNKKTN